MMDDAGIGRRVRQLRGDMPQRHVVTVLQVLHGISWHQTTVAKVEAGERPLKLTEAVALAELFGVPVAALTDEGEKSANAMVVRELEALHRQIRGRLEELRG